MATVSFNHQWLSFLWLYAVSEKHSAEKQQAVHNWFYHQTTEFYQKGIYHFIYRWKNVSNRE
jgi:hypothetical protein